MFEGMYGHIQKKPMRRTQFLDEELTLDAYLNSDLNDVQEKVLVKAVIKEFKKLLEIPSSHKLIEELFNLESKMTKIFGRLPEEDLIDLGEFYRELAPILLQKYWERAKNPLKEETIDRLFLESIHIAIEEEIYIWQEKIQ